MSPRPHPRVHAQGSRGVGGWRNRTARSGLAPPLPKRPSGNPPSPPAHREILRVASTVMHGVGHVLLGASNYIRRLLDGGENWHHHARLTSYDG